MMKLRFLSLFITISLVFLEPVNAEKIVSLSRPFTMKVLVFDHLKRLDIRIHGKYVILDNKKKIITAGFNLQKGKIVSRRDRFYFNDRMVSQGMLTIETIKDGYIMINKKPYYGSLTCKVRGKGGFKVINNVLLEKYLEGVLAGETFAKTPIEALKTQAVISRTCALHTMLKKSDKEYYVTKKFPQMYVARNTVGTPFEEAVKGTQGKILTVEGRVVPIYFSSSCGGVTEHDRYVWKTKESNTVRVTCPYCRYTPDFRWKLNMTLGEFRRLLMRNNKSIGKVYGINVSKRVIGTERAEVITIRHSKGTSEVKANWLRKKIGPNKLKSTYFVMSFNGDRLIFNGKGWGHGVGLCQSGAREMASRGKTAQEILSFYYPHMRVKKVE